MVHALNPAPQSQEELTARIIALEYVQVQALGLALSRVPAEQEPAFIKALRGPEAVALGALGETVQKAVGHHVTQRWDDARKVATALRKRASGS